MLYQDIMGATSHNPVTLVDISHAGLFFQRLCNDFRVPIILIFLFAREICYISMAIYIHTHTLHFFECLLPWIEFTKQNSQL
jgi:ectoine hydroxylase-related dioxygenase (phytanoyl-CoA dioxygenase family)